MIIIIKIPLSFFSSKFLFLFLLLSSDISKQRFLAAISLSRFEKRRMSHHPREKEQSIRSSIMYLLFEENLESVNCCINKFSWSDLIKSDPDNEIGSVGERGGEHPRWRDQPIGRVGNFEFSWEQDNLVSGQRKLVEKFARIGSERERYKRDVRYQIVGTVAVVEGPLPVEEPVVGVGRIDKPHPRGPGRRPMRYIFSLPSP